MVPFSLTLFATRRAHRDFAILSHAELNPRLQTCVHARNPEDSQEAEDVVAVLEMNLCERSAFKRWSRGAARGARQIRASVSAAKKQTAFSGVPTLSSLPRHRATRAKRQDWHAAASSWTTLRLVTSRRWHWTAQWKTFIWELGQACHLGRDPRNRGGVIAKIARSAAPPPSNPLRYEQDVRHWS